MEFYNKHYIKVDSSSRIVDGFSDAFRQPTEGCICINEQGGYQFRLLYLVYDPSYELTYHHRVSEENPSLFDFEHMIPLYKYEGGYVKLRTDEEIEADRQIAMLPTEVEVRAQRDKLLAETDWTQVADAPIDSATRSAMRVYRQLLRDVTEQEGFPTQVVWPEMPTVVKAIPEPIDEVVEAIIGVEVTE